MLKSMDMGEMMTEERGGGEWERWEVMVSPLPSSILPSSSSSSSAWPLADLVVERKAPTRGLETGERLPLMIWWTVNDRPVWKAWACAAERWPWLTVVGRGEKEEEV